MSKKRKTSRFEELPDDSALVPRPGADVRFVWGRKQIEHMETRVEETGQRRDIDRDTFVEAWRDPDRIDVQVTDLGPIVKVLSDASVRDRGEITLVWFFPRNDPLLVIPRTAYFPPAGLEGKGMLDKGRERRRRRHEEGRKRRRVGGRGTSRRE